MKSLIVAIFIFVLSSAALAQNILVIRVVASGNNAALEGVTVITNGKSTSTTDSNGLSRINLSAGNAMIKLSYAGFQDKAVDLQQPFPDTLFVTMIEKEQAMEEVTVISSTRNNQRIENSPLKVEVLGSEEMGEENAIRPANIASILGDISGVQIQQSSATSGNANVRMQGLDGRYTQLLHDGMPLFEGFSGGFGVLSIPPLDLKQVELIKGSASTLYGGGAIGGLVNIISKTPGKKQEGIFTLNQTTLKETDINSFFSKRYNKAGYSFFCGYTRQNATDVNKDGFSDVPLLRTLMLHPKIFIYPSDKLTLIASYAMTFEKRKGGDMQVLKNKEDSIHQYFEFNRTLRHTGEFIVESRLVNNKKLSLKTSFSSFKRTITTNTHFFKGRQFNYYSELSLLVPYKQNSLVAGINFLGDDFIKLPSDPILLNNFRSSTVGAFIQNTLRIKEGTVLDAGVRDDYHQVYGNFFLPRLALFHRLTDQWATRAGVGFGYKIPNPLAPQTVDPNIEQILPLLPGIRSERSVGYNAEVNYKKKWTDGSELFVNEAFFLTRLNDPVTAVEDSTGNVFFVNASGPVISKGMDTYFKAVVDEWELYAGYTLTIAERKYLPNNPFIPLTPKHRIACTLVKNFEKNNWKIGIEASYNGHQYRYDGSETPGYTFLAGMIEKKTGKKIAVILNAENILNYRQSKIENLYTGPVANPHFNPLWAPIDGRSINISIRFIPYGLD